MATKRLLLVTVTGTLVLAALWWRQQSPRDDVTAAPVTTTTTTHERAAANEPSNGPTEFPGRTSPTITPQDGDDLLARPEVVAYLTRESERQQLQDWFAQPNEAEAQAIWTLIEELESQRRVLGAEALHLKLAWLEIDSETADEYNQRAEALMASYRARAEAAREQNDPRTTPGYTSYREQQAAIVTEVMAMTQFPAGHTRQSYLRERLLQARITAYGEEQP